MKLYYLKGIFYTLALAVPAALLGERFPIIGGPVFGILASEVGQRTTRSRTSRCMVTATPFRPQVETLTMSSALSKRVPATSSAPLA